MSEKTFLTREEILGFNDSEVVEIQIPEWGGKWIRVRGLTAIERDRIELAVLNRQGEADVSKMENLRVKMVVACAVDESGAALFTPVDIAALAKKNAKPVARIFDAARKLSGMTNEDVEELTKN